LEHNHISRGNSQCLATLAANVRRKPLGRFSDVDVERQSSYHSGSRSSTQCSSLSSLITIEQHRGDMSGPEASVHEILMRISGQFASEYMVYRGLQEEVKKAFATGNFKY
jgi:hypothetical protein